MAVRVAAGDTTLIVTPAATTSAAQLRAIAISAALVAAYWLRPALPRATRLPISTTRPAPLAAIAGIRMLPMRAADSTWMRHIVSPSCAFCLPSDPTRNMPAA